MIFFFIFACLQNAMVSRQKRHGANNHGAARRLRRANNKKNNFMSGGYQGFNPNFKQQSSLMGSSSFPMFGQGLGGGGMFGQGLGSGGLFGQGLGSGGTFGQSLGSGGLFGQGLGSGGTFGQGLGSGGMFGQGLGSGGMFGQKSLPEKNIWETFDHDLLKALQQEGDEPDNDRMQMKLSGNIDPKIKFFIAKKMIKKEKMYNAVLRAVKQILDMNGFRYFEDNSKEQREIYNLIQQLLNPTISGNNHFKRRMIRSAPRFRRYNNRLRAYR